MNRNCPICDGTAKTLIYHQKFSKNDITLMSEYNVVGCLKCGFAYADNIPTQYEFDKYYEKMSKYEDDYTNNEHNKKIFDFLSKYIKNKAARILDIGCGTGGLLSIFKENGYTNLYGLDPSKKCVDKLNEKGINGLQGTISNLKEDHQERFDVIILSSVLEHLVDLKGSMMKISSMSKPSGLLFVEVPNAARFAGYIFVPFQQFSIEHINYFSHWSIDNLLKMFYFDRFDMQNMENKTNQTVDPCLFIAAVNKYHEPTKNHVTIENLNEYVNLSFTKEKTIQEKVYNMMSEYRRIIVWGCGTHTQMLIGKGFDLTKVAYFVDSNSNYDGKKINSIEVRDPRRISDEYPILISSWSYQKEIEQQIKSMGLKNEVLKIYE